MNSLPLSVGMGAAEQRRAVAVIVSLIWAARGCPAQAEVFIQSQAPSHSPGHGVSSHLPGKLVKRNEWLKTPLPLSCICEDLTEQFSASGNSALGLVDRVKQ